jgi:hypothetical protein
MKLYTVLIPITAAVAIVFESDEELTDAQAFDKALNKDWTVDAFKSDKDPGDTFDISLNEYEPHEYIVKGNTYCGVINEYDVESEEVEKSDIALEL